MKNIMLSIIAICVLVGMGKVSADEISKEKYSDYAVLGAMLVMCFEADMISSKLYVESDDAYIYKVKSWNFDEQRLKNIIIGYMSTTKITKQHCKRFEVQAYEMIIEVNNHKKELANRKYNKPEVKPYRSRFKYTSCNKILNQVNCTTY